MGKIDLEYEVRQSTRASKPRIDVDLDGVTVVIPEQLPLDPDQLLDEKQEWVRKKLREMEQLRSRIPHRSFEEGATFPYRGDDLEVKLASVDPSRVTDCAFELNKQDVRERSLKDELEAVYRREAEELIAETLEQYAGTIGVDYGTVKIKNQKTLWGSCSSRKNLNFNWRIMMAPPGIAEYVVIHELCHLVHSNHGEAFWELLSTYVDEPREKARWLKDHAVELIFTKEDL